MIVSTQTKGCEEFKNGFQNSSKIAIANKDLYKMKSFCC